MIKIDVFIKEKKWKNHISDPKKYLENKIKKIKITKNLIKKKKFQFLDHAWRQSRYQNFK